MSEATVKPADKPKRPVGEVQAELSKARARLREIHPRVELDARRGNAHADRVKKQLEAWKKLHPDEPFDELDAGFSVEPYEFDRNTQEEFHGLHYAIARLEDELAAATKHRAKA